MTSMFRASPTICSRKTGKFQRRYPAWISYHWVLVDIPPTQRLIEAGSYSKEVKPRGKNGPAAPNNTRQG